ncbi:MAG: gamma-glutamylcyclotransferase [Maribacter sp.]|nr:gamma-glutamylcyclotransferase [Maribacter sp.]
MEVVGDLHSESLAATQYLFTYGTLQDETVQYAHFKRKLVGDQDVLPYYRIAEELIANAYPNVTYTGNPDDSVPGITYLLTNKELLKADTYEGQAYQRIEVELSSGKKAWLYLGKINRD